MSADVHALAGAYALHALPPDEQAFFERHLAMCDACRAEVAEFRETASRLGAGVAAAPPAALRARVLAAADVTRQLPPDRPAVAHDTPTPWQRFKERALLPVAACLAIVVVALTGVTLRLNNQIQDIEAAQSPAVVSILGAEDLQTVQLDLGGSTPGRFLYSPTLDRGVLVAHGVADPGGHEAYELWLIHDGTPVPAGVFRPSVDGAAVAEVSAPVRGAELVAITVEPRAGSQRPTGEILTSAELDA
jgi:anti-sigma-K factor RskA